MRTYVSNALDIFGKPIFLLIENGKFIEVSDSEIAVSDPASLKKVDANGLTVLPGLFDFQVHFREPGQTHKETIETGSESAVAGGFTRVLCMANTTPPLDSAELVKANIDRGKEVGLCDVFFSATVSKSLKGEVLTDFSALKNAGAMALTDDGHGVQSDDLMYQAFLEAKKVGLPILDHAEDVACNQGGVMHDSDKAKKWGLSISVPEAESNHIERGVKLSLETGARYHALHVATRLGVEALRKGKKLGANVSGEVSPHHLLLCVDDIPELTDGPDSNYKMNPTLKSKSDQEACLEGVLDGTLSVIATDHAPHTLEEKSKGFQLAPFGIVGLETCFPLIYTKFVRTGILSLEKVVNMLNDAPASIVGLKPNMISKGAEASFTLVDLNTTKAIDSNSFKTKGRNTPFNGWLCQGWSKFTFYQGHIVFHSN